jgi:hypothetical protein
MSNEVFISYSWSDASEPGESREVIVNEICQQLEKEGLKIVRDKKDVCYKDDIRLFEERLGKGSYIILVVSDKFLRSKHCMFEVLTIMNHENVYKRIFPVILEDARIFDPVERMDYVDYWIDEESRLDKRVRRGGPLAITTHIQAELVLYDRISRIFDEFAALLSRMCTLSPEQHRNHNFSQLLAAIKLQMAADATENIEAGAKAKGQETSVNNGVIATGNITMTGNSNIIGSNNQITTNK